MAEQDVNTKGLRENVASHHKAPLDFCYSGNVSSKSSIDISMKSSIDISMKSSGNVSISSVSSSSSSGSEKESTRRPAEQKATVKEGDGGKKGVLSRRSEEEEGEEEAEEEEVRGSVGYNKECRGSTGTEVSDSNESSTSNTSSCLLLPQKPHKANDVRWEAIRTMRAKEGGGTLGLNHFRLLKRLGSGDIGSVYLAELRGTSCFFAMKVMDKASLASRKKLLRANTEREILQSLDHPFLPSLYTHFETDKFSCLVMEFCSGGDLHVLRQRQPGKHFSELAARFYAAEVLLSLEYLHMMGVVYRDLKPENVLVREDGHIMLSDFDLSLQCVVRPTLVKSAMPDMDPSRRIPAYCVQPACLEPSCITPACVQPSCFGPKLLPSLSSKKKSSKQKMDIGNQVSPLPELIAEPTGARSLSFVGTHEYLAPEIIKGEGHGSAVDWWTFGIFLYELLHGRTPFKGAGNRATLFNVIGQPLKFPEVPSVSFAARDLVRGLLVKDPQQRLGSKRGATEIKQHPFFDGVNWALIRSMTPPQVPKPFENPLGTIAPAPNEKKGDTSSGSYLDFDFF